VWEGVIAKTLLTVKGGDGKKKKTKGCLETGGKVTVPSDWEKCNQTWVLVLLQAGGKGELREAVSDLGGEGGTGIRPEGEKRVFRGLLSGGDHRKK